MDGVDCVGRLRGWAASSGQSANGEPFLHAAVDRTNCYSSHTLMNVLNPGVHPKLDIELRRIENYFGTQEASIEISHLPLRASLRCQPCVRLRVWVSEARATNECLVRKPPALEIDRTALRS